MVWDPSRHRGLPCQPGSFPTSGRAAVASPGLEGLRQDPAPPLGHLWYHSAVASTGQTGFTVWLTGLSGAGKTTIGHAVAGELERRGLHVEVLDGDIVRTHLSKGLGYSHEDRDTNIERIGWVASRLTRHSAAVVVAAISPYDTTRKRVRALVEEHGPFVEVWVKASVEECARRDVKGLYAKAFAGEITQFTGVDDPYEEPDDAEVVADTVVLSPDESVALVMAELERIGVVRPADLVGASPPS